VRRNVTRRDNILARRPQSLITPTAMLIAAPLRLRASGLAAVSDEPGRVTRLLGDEHKRASVRGRRLRWISSKLSF
jgi:hypothetical protein